ncbi:MAG: hypothetical protein VX394_02160, partial [Pseudomonadota bacterium]|nr:hypothetical protein [Pseudomonadota bacterium]
MQRRALAWGAVIPVALAVACAGPPGAWERPVPAAELAVAMADKPAVLAPYVETLLAQGPRNAVLNHGRIGFLAFELGRPRLAQAQLENAAQAIETVYADNPAAELARSNFAREDVKDFKGEPFERAMVFYYLGLSYLALGDFENARASFKAGEYQDSLSRAEKYQADFALLNFLAGWAAHCAGRPAGRRRRQFRGRRPLSPRPDGAGARRQPPDPVRGRRRADQMGGRRPSPTSQGARGPGPAPAGAGGARGPSRRSLPSGVNARRPRGRRRAGRERGVEGRDVGGRR